MTGFNRMGPVNMGPGTGKKLGYCFNEAGLRGKFGRERGMGGFFCRNRVKSENDIKQVLADYRKELEEELESVKREEQKLDEKGKDVL